MEKQRKRVWLALGGAARGRDVLPALRGVLAGDCPRRGFPNIQDLCNVHFPELPELFLRR